MAAIDRPQAGLARRLAASLYESLLLGALAVAIGLVLLPLSGATTAAPALALPGAAARVLSFACLFTVWGLYCIALWSGGRRSLPMHTWGLTLSTAAGAPLSPGRAALRYLGGWIGPICTIVAYLVLRPYGLRRWAVALLMINYAWALVDPDRRFLHDRLAGTRLLRTATAPRTPTRRRSADSGPPGPA